MPNDAIPPHFTVTNPIGSLAQAGHVFPLTVIRPSNMDAYRPNLKIIIGLHRDIIIDTLKQLVSDEQLQTIIHELRITTDAMLMES